MKLRWQALREIKVIQIFQIFCIPCEDANLNPWICWWVHQSRISMWVLITISLSLLDLALRLPEVPSACTAASRSFRRFPSCVANVIAPHLTACWYGTASTLLQIYKFIFIPSWGELSENWTSTAKIVIQKLDQKSATANSCPSA